jgi:hypothetical protein
MVRFALIYLANHENGLLTKREPAFEFEKSALRPRSGA